MSINTDEILIIEELIWILKHTTIPRHVETATINTLYRNIYSAINFLLSDNILTAIFHMSTEQGEVSEPPWRA